MTRCITCAVVGAIDAGHPEDDRRRRQQAIADDAVHHRRAGSSRPRAPPPPAGWRRRRAPRRGRGPRDRRAGTRSWCRRHRDRSRTARECRRSSSRALLYNPNDACLDADPTSRNERHARARPARHRAPEPAPPPPRSAPRAVAPAPPPAPAAQPGDPRAVGPARIADAARPDRSPRRRPPPAAASTRCCSRCAAAATPTTTAPSSRAAPASPPTFDPLAYAIAAAGKSGLRVHVWFNTNLVASTAMLPTEPHPRRQRAPRVADGAAADRRRSGQARAAPSALRAAAGRVDEAQRRRRSKASTPRR